MNVEVEADLRAIEAGSLSLNRQETLSALLPGLPPEQVRAELATAGFASSSGLESWYGWHNGSNGSTIGVSQIVPGYYPLSLEESVGTNAVFRQHPGWETRWLPLLADGGGYFYVLDQSLNLPWPIRRFRYDQSDHPVEYLSLERFLATVAAGYRERAFTAHPDGHLAVDTVTYDRIAAELNPGVDWWA